MKFMSPSLARWFLIGGVVTALLGFVLWFLLPIRLTFPPFLITSILSMGYGVFGLANRGKSRRLPPS